MGIPSFMRAVATALCIMLAASSAYAQAPGGNADPERLAAARELLQATNADRQFTTLIPLIFNQLRQNMPPAGPKEQQIRDQVFDEVQKQIIARRGEIVDQIAALYARKFTAAEMREVAAFYRTPTGQKFIASMPELAQESMKMGNDWGRKIAEEAIQKLREEMKKRGVEQ